MKAKAFIKKYVFANLLMEKILLTLSNIFPFFSKLIPGNKMYAYPTHRIVKRKGINFNLDISDYQEHLIYFNLDNDSSTYILKYLPLKDSFILDIGANVGQTSLWMAKHLQNTKSTIIAFEPFPTTSKKLEENVGLNDFTSIKIENIALGAEDSTMEMVEETFSNSGGYRVFNSQLHQGKKTTIVSMMKLDSYFKNSSKKLDFIKIDVEGYEYQVLSGGVQILKIHYPILFIELDDNNLKQQGHSAIELLELLDNLGYNSIVKAQTNSPLTDTNFENCHFDIVCRSLI